MGTQSYYHDRAAGEVSERAEPPPAPAALRWLIPAVSASVVLLVALPVLMIVDRTATARSIRENTPNLDPAHLDLAVATVLVYSVALHTVAVVLSIWFVVKVLRGRQWARIALSAYLVVTILASAYSVTAGTMYLWMAMATNVLNLAMLILLWVPKPTREFFAARRGPNRVLARPS